MPSARLPVVFSSRAKRDQTSILRQSIITWGREQAAAYEKALDQAIDRLGNHPEIGRQRDDLVPGIRSLAVEQHVIYYRVRPTSIRIIRILHGKRDASSILGG